MAVCRSTFILMLGVFDTSFYRCKSECIPSRSMVTEEHRLTKRFKTNSNKFDKYSYIVTTSAIDKICEENSIIPPWHATTAFTEKVCIIPPMFNKNRLYMYVVNTVPEELCLGRSSFYNILEGKYYNHIVFCKKGKDLCDMCSSIQHIANGLETKEDPDHVQG